MEYKKRTQYPTGSAKLGKAEDTQAEMSIILGLFVESTMKSWVTTLNTVKYIFL